ncbi:MAG: 3-hydroxyacyl-CoA dehydrogenase, partial [Roseomonas sp.]|nr:3-hydroxyacyl-CoA dehydrogenase [Roseomonas sp.]
LNAPGGVADYAARFGGLMGGITEEQAPFLYDEATVARVTAERPRRAALAEDWGAFSLAGSAVDGGAGA